MSNLIKVDELIAVLTANQPKAWWECTEDMFLRLSHLSDNNGYPVLEASAVAPANSNMASGTLLGVPIHVHRLATWHLALCVQRQPGAGVERFEYTPPCECREFKVSFGAPKGALEGQLVCTDCGQLSDTYKVVMA